MQEYTHGTLAIISGASALLGAVSAFLTAWLKGKNSLNEQIDRRIEIILDQKEKTIADRDRTIEDRDLTIGEMRQTIGELNERVNQLERKDRERSNPEVVT